MFKSDSCVSSDFKLAPAFFLVKLDCFKILKQLMRPGNMKTTMTSRLSYD